MQHISVFSSSFEVLQASPFTSQQLWLSRQEEALNPLTLYSSYAHDPTSPPPARCLTLFSATRLKKARRRAAHPPPPPPPPPLPPSSTRCQAKQKTLK